MRSIINIGTKMLEVNVEGNGQPVVILPGLSSAMDEWEEVSSELSNRAQVIMFHRAGCGESELGTEKRNISATVNDLKMLLNKLNVDDPVILIGHSYGGLCAQHFAFEHPDNVRSLILVESSSTDFELLEEVIGQQNTKLIEMYRGFSKMKPTQLRSILNKQLLPEQQNLTDEAKERILEFKSKPLMYQAMADELEEMTNDASLIKKFGELINIRLTVIGREPEYSIKMMISQGMPEQQAVKIEDVWQKLIKNQLHLSSNSNYILAENCYHNVYTDRPSLIVEDVNSLLR
ncbi:alpha/beta fold hydrolase [Virgibacillus ndiopensis]|uniref:alpha/beta fold hydrolase n=1 Tax=Virgibacillus ndiopensis TaxID=2004408 RepID=UPI000C06F3A2|nr:alpha/beta fold hydrolase [Virgibacillus ndiopensis]